MVSLLTDFTKSTQTIKNNDTITSNNTQYQQKTSAEIKPCEEDRDGRQRSLRFFTTFQFSNGTAEILN